MTSPLRDLYSARVVRFAGDPTWPEAPDDAVPDTSFEGSVVALAIARSADRQGYFTFWLYEDGSVADSYDVSLDDAIEAAADEGDRLGWVDVPD